MTTREPEFNDDDRGLLLTDHADANAPRSSTGVLMSEATDPALRHLWDVDLITDFTVESQSRVLKKFRDASGKDADLSAIRAHVHRSDRVMP